MPTPVVERSKAKVCGLSLAGVAGSKFVGGMDVCVVSKDKKAKCRTNKTQKQARMKYRVQENTHKKKIPVGLFSAPGPSRPQYNG